MTMIATSTQEALAEWEWESIEEEEQKQLQDGSIDYALIQVFVCPRSRTVAERENNRECSWLPWPSPLNFSYIPRFDMYVSLGLIFSLSFCSPSTSRSFPSPSPRRSSPSAGTARGRSPRDADTSCRCPKSHRRRRRRWCPGRGRSEDVS